MIKHFIFFVMSLFILIGVNAQQVLAPDWNVQSDVANSLMGTNLGGAGNLNGDQYPDLYVTSSYFSLSIYYGSSTGFPTNPSAVIDESGVSYYAVTCGDLNNDGKEDLIVGDYSKNQFRVHYGNSAGISTTANLVYTAPEGSGYFGYSLDARGDVNKDGFKDLLVGQPRYDRGFGLYGNTKVFLGAAAGITTVPSQTITTPIATIGIGTHVCYAGDVNNDNYEDVLITSQNIPGVALLSSELVELYLGSSGGSLVKSSWYDIGRVMKISKAFDVNKDNYDDVAITYYDNTFAKYNASVYHGKASGLESNPAYEKDGGFVGTISGIGDFNGDGFGDVVLNDQEFDEGSYYNQGKVEVLVGTPAGISSTPHFVYKSNVSNSNVGTVGIAGDLNADGFDDLLLGWPKFASGQFQEGKAMLFFGRTSLISDFTVSNTKECILNNVFSFTSLALNGPVTYLWDFGDGTTSSAANPTHSYSNPGVYSVSLEVTNSLGHKAKKTEPNYITVKADVPGGVYTVGGASPDFATIALLNDFLQCGIRGNTTIKFRPGKYYERINLVGINDPAHTLTIESENQTPATTRIGFINIENSKNIYVNNLSFYDSSSAYYTYQKSSVRIFGSNNISFTNCQIYQRHYSAFYYDCTIAIDNSDNITLKKLFVDSRPDSLTAQSTIAIKFRLINNFVLDSSTIIDPRFNSWGVVGRNSRNVQITNNIVRGRTQKAYWGVSLDTIVGMRIERNKLYMLEHPLIIDHGSGIGSMNIIANNSIGEDIGTADYYHPGHAVSIQNCTTLNFYHNTISYTTTGTENYSSYQVALWVYNSNAINVKNNIIKTAPGTYCLGSYGSTISSDYNFFSGGVKMVYASSYYRYDLNQWRAISGQDMNSMYGDIGFENTRKLKPSLNKDRLNEAAFTLSTVLTDIQFQDRGAASTDMGAYNVDGDTLHYAFDRNIMLSKITTDLLSLGDNSIQVKFKNLKPLTVDSVYLTYKIDGGVEVRELWTGQLNYRDSVTYTFATPYNVSRGRIYNIECSASFPPAKKDSDTTNNYLKKELYCRMSGAYTVYGTAPDFINIRQANYHLTRAGIASKVTFLLRPGNHTDTLSLESGPVEYRSESGNANDVSIGFFINWGKNNVAIKNISLVNHYAYLENCTNVIVDSCIIIAPNSSPEYPGIRVLPQSLDVKFLNCSFFGTKYGVLLDGSTPWYGSYRIGGNIEIKNCVFDSVKYPVMISSDNTDTDAIIIHNNTMKHATSAVYVVPQYRSSLNLRNVTISNNTMDSCIAEGIALWSNVVCEIYNNTIYSLGTNGILTYGIYGADIYNNMIRVRNFNYGSVSNNQGTHKVSAGIVVQSSSAVKIFNNSLRGGIYIGYAGATVCNNSCYTDSTIAYYIQSVSREHGNNNIYRKDGGYCAVVSNINKKFKNIDSIGIVTGYEKLSISVDPQYVSETDLHSSNSYLQKRGKAGSLAFDIDGDARDPEFPAIGADENNLPVVDTRPLVTYLYPENGSSNVPTDSLLIIRFDRRININVGEVYIQNYSTGAIAHSIYLPSSAVVLSDTNELTLQIPSGKLDYGVLYKVRFSSGSVYNQGMGNYAIDDPAQWNFTTEIVAPLIVTTSITSITDKGGSVTYRINSTGGSPIQKNGICWSTSPIFDMLPSFIVDNSTAIGNHSILLNTLAPNTDYYVKSFAINEIDTSYGNVIHFRTNVLTSLISSSEDVMQIELYPNPVTSELAISTEHENVLLEIYNLQGVNVRTEKLQNRFSLIQLDELPAGGYVLKFNVGNTFLVKSIIKK